MFWNKSAPATSTVENCADGLFRFLANGLRKDGRIRAEDMISVAASITGEICIEAAGNFNPRKHDLVPGSRVFSDRVNELFCGDKPDDIGAVPSQSIVGILRDRLLLSGYVLSDFPELKLIFEHFAGSIGKSSDWGKVPLSVADENKPVLLPLRVAYETRTAVDKMFHPLRSPQGRLHASVLTLAKTLIAVRDVIDKKIALLLALETVNGMAKTAPMTDDAMAAAKKNAPS